MTYTHPAAGSENNLPSDAVRVSHLVKRYGDFMAVSDLSLSIGSGEILGLLGPNGSGKTTTINCILQLLSHDRGEIEIFGQRMTPTSYDLKRRIGVVPQNVAVYDELNVRENIDAFASLYIHNRRERRARVDEAIAFVGLEDFTRFRPKQLSGGLLRRLNIACGIAHAPDLIILDEPTVAVDPQSRNAILEGIERLNERGATIIYTSHYMEEVEQLCTRIVIVDRGEEVASGTSAQLKSMVNIGERIRIEIVDPTPLPEQLLAQIKEMPKVRSARVNSTDLHIDCLPGAHNLADILGILAHKGVTYGQVTSEPPTLNEVFLEITGRDLRDEA